VCIRRAIVEYRPFSVSALKSEDWFVDRYLSAYISIRQRTSAYTPFSVSAFNSAHCIVGRFLLVSMYLCIYVSMYLCIYVSMYLCVYESIYRWSSVRRWLRTLDDCSLLFTSANNSCDVWRMRSISASDLKLLVYVA
jgi:hypothetical protein